MGRGVVLWAALGCVAGCGSSFSADSGIDGGLDAGIVAAADAAPGRDAAVDGGAARCGPPGECDLALGGCPTGEACRWVGGSPAFRTECGPVGVGEALDLCDTNTDCGRGLGCVPTGSVRTCTPYCCETVPCTTPYFPMCPNVAGGGGAAACYLEGECHPVDPRFDVCEAGEQCYPGAAGTTCLRAGDSADGDACAVSSECGLGLLCLPAADGTSRCTRLCDPGGIGAGCEAGETCTPLDVGTPGVGVCRS